MREQWKKSKIGEFAKVKGGKRLPKGKQLISESNAHPYIRIRDLGKSKYLQLNTEYGYVDDETQKSIARYIVNEGDILISVVGTIGLIGIVGKSLDGANQTENCDKIVNIKEVLPEYLYYYLISNLGQEEIKRGIVGAVQPKLPLKNVQNITVLYPKLENQEKIVKILNVIDNKINTNNEINENLYELTKVYYTSLSKYAEFEMTTIGNYAERIYSGGTPKTSNADYWNGSFGWFSSGETRNRFVVSTEKTITQNGINNSSTKLASKYDIVMASAGQGFTRGQTSMLLIDTYVNQSVIVIHADRNTLPYLFWNLSNRYEELRAISDSSSIRGSLTTKMLAGFEIQHVSDEALLAFADFAWPIISKIENNLLENERLTTLRDSLLPKLISGELDVSSLDF